MHEKIMVHNIMDLLEAAKIYYQRYFSFDMLFRVIQPNTFANREFGFTIIREDKKIFKRNLSFKDPSLLRKYIVENNVIGIYVGAVYSVRITPNNPINKNYWLGRELIFDLDLTDYDDVRTCGKGKDHYCEQCWPLIKNAAIFIDETLKEDFGFNEITWIYSGRRGLHAWVRDKESFFLDEEVRESIADYVNLGNKNGFVPLGLKKRAIKIYSKVQIDKVPTKLSEQKQFINKIWNEIKKYLPRIDKSVTMDTVRLLRMPGSIHDSTGKIVTIIDDLENFYPDTVPSVYQIVGEKSVNFKVQKD